MRKIKETILVVYSVIMLILSVVLIMLMFNILDINIIVNMVEGLIIDSTLSTIMLVISIIFILASLYCIFKDNGDEKKSKDSILLENEKGNLLISRVTLEKIVASVVNNFESIKIGKTNIRLNEEGKLNIEVFLFVSENVIIKELSHNIQIKIQEAIKRACDLEVSKVNVNIQGIIETKSEV